MKKKRICISLDENMYSKLEKFAYENYGTGKMSISTFAVFILNKAINRLHNFEDSNKIGLDHGCVYIIQEIDSGYVKIGFAKDFDKRINSIRTDNPHDIKTIAVVSGCIMQDEIKLHKKYCKYRIWREWYNSAILKEIYDDIKLLQKKSTMTNNLPTSSEHYLYLMET